MNMAKLIWAVIWRIGGFVMLWGVLCASFIVLGARRFEMAGTMSPQVRLYFELAAVATILVAAWAMLHFIDRRPFVTLGFALDHALRDSLIGLLVGTGMILLAIIILWLAGWLQFHTSSDFSWSVLAFAGLAMLFNTITQQVLVRGYILQTIQAEGGALIAVISSAVLFSLLHAGATRGALLPSFNLFIAGVLLGYAYIATGNLWMPIALHFAWNFLQGPVLGLTVSGQSLDSGWRIFQLNGPGIFTGGTFGLEGGLVATITTMVGLLALYGLYRR